MPMETIKTTPKPQANKNKAEAHTVELLNSKASVRPSCHANFMPS